MINDPFFSRWEHISILGKYGCRSTVDQQLAAFLQAVPIGDREDINPEA